MKKVLLILLFFPLVESPAHALFEGDSAKRAAIGGPDYPYPEISGVQVQNNTDYDIEELVAWFCNRIGLRDVFIRVSYLREVPGYDGMVVMHHPKIYFIRIRKDINNYRWVCLHELIHVKQYVSGDLSVLGKSVVSYKGKRINLDEVDYKHRHYEHEAQWETVAFWKKFMRYKRDNGDVEG